MNIFFPKEQYNEARFSLTGETAQKFLKKNINLSVEENIDFQDALLRKLIKENSINILSREK